MCLWQAPPPGGESVSLVPLTPVSLVPLTPVSLVPLTPAQVLVGDTGSDPISTGCAARTFSCPPALHGTDILAWL